MRNKKTVLIKYLALMLILVSALLLSACRTRITNNNEVSNVYYDEEGYLSETYEMRRSELSLSTAKKPLLPDFGPIEDDEEDFDTGESIDYEPEEEEYIEPPEVQNANNTSRTTNRSTRTTTNRSSSGSNTSRTTERVTIKFDANGGKCNTAEKRVYKGSKIGSLPEATKDRKTTKIWCQSKDGSKPVSSDVIVNEDITLYARWDKEEKKEEKETVTITFNANGGDNPPKSRTKDKGSTYGDIASLKESMSFEGHTFIGWSTSEKGQAAVKATDKIPTGSKSMTLYAIWSKDTVELTLDAKGGSNGGTFPVNKGSKYQLPISELADYIFRGWEDENGNTYVGGYKLPVDTDMTLTAIWEKAYDYWDKEYNDKLKEYLDGNDKADAVILPGDVDDEGILNDLIKEPTGDKYPVICFVDNDKIDSTYETLRETYDRVYVISSDAVKGGNNSILACQIDMFKRLLDDEMDSQKAEKELGVTVKIRDDDNK